MPPTISTITPDNGLSIGEDCVTIVGTGFGLPSLGQSVRVLFGGVESPEAGAIDANTIIALTPPGILGDVDVVVENTLPGPVIESVTAVDGYTYRRPNIATNRDKAASEDAVILVVNRELISELRRTVLQNTHHDTHPEYVDAFSEARGTEVMSTAPNLKVVGPTVSEDRFYSVNGAYSEAGLAGVFNNYTQPVTVRLDYKFVGVGRTSGEAANLWRAITLWLDRTSVIEIARDGNDKANGVLAFELAATPEERGDFGTTDRQGFYQFSGAFHVRGVHAVSRAVCPSREVLDSVLTTIKITPS